MVNTSEFLWPIRVYYEDTDTAGVVYHGRYLNFMERARTEWLRDMGFEQDQLKTELGIIFTITALSVRYLQAIRFNQQLNVSVELDKLRRASMVLRQRIYPAGSDDVSRTLCDATVTVACVEAQGFKPVAIPDFIKKEILSER